MTTHGCIYICITYIYRYYLSKYIYIYKALFHLYPDSKFAGAPESIFYGIFTQVMTTMDIYICVIYIYIIYLNIYIYIQGPLPTC